MRGRDSCRLCGAQRVDAQLGLEPTIDAYVAELVTVFREVWRVLREDGTVWLNLGDSYAASNSGTNGFRDGRTNREHRRGPGIPEASKPKDLLGIPWMVAFALRDDGWYLRSDIIWHKPNPMPESVTDRPTKSHEYVFLLSKEEQYFYDGEAIKEPVTGTSHVRERNGMNPKRALAGWNCKSNPTFTANELVDERNKRSVWTIPTEAYGGGHFATFPEALVEPCILAGSRLGDLVLDPFLGSGTVGQVAERLGRRWIGTDLAYQDLAKARTAQRGLQWVELKPTQLASAGDLFVESEPSDARMCPYAAGTADPDATPGRSTPDGARSAPAPGGLR